ncbi:MAG: isoprenylcysteine carboxylmethyltransferase family protein [Ignavibacteriales bacterium CG_4_9_14_3_um_filter_30_11]|nr:MAG: isoprenylcysteine carboxylmethyltransferase family protein [Ignavibacteriales bacterium CG_4_9_14_3_um_filter_30_11]
MKNIAKKFFNYRSYTPIPFLILMFVFQKATIPSLIIGFFIALVGELIRLWGVSWAGSETRTTGGVGGTFLIISGPFAFVRNPLYVGNILLYTGFGVMSLALFPYMQIFALLFFLFQYYLIVREEESFLIIKFGKEFENYIKYVPRFFPRFTPYKPENVIQPELNIKAGLRSEKRSMQAFILVTVLLIVESALKRYF